MANLKVSLAGVLAAFLVAAFLVPMVGADDSNAPGASVNIMNALNDTMLVHCQSKDSDLGARPVEPGTNYYWDFHPNIFGVTLYNCEFYWKDKMQNFQVWKGSYYDNRPLCSVRGPCTYKVRQDGFYYAVDNGGDATNAISWAFYRPWLDIGSLG